MLGLTLAQMRRSAGRLAAAGIAIAIGTAFVAATLLAGDLIKRATYDSVTASYADATVVVQTRDVWDWTVIEPGVVEAVRELDDVAAAAGFATTPLELRSDGRSVYQVAVSVRTDPRLQPLVVGAGRFPVSDDEIALPRATAERLRLEIGDTVDQHGGYWSDDEEVWVPVVTPLTLVGLSDDPRGAYLVDGGAAVVTDEALEAYNAAATGSEPGYDGMLVLARDGADLEALMADVRAAVPAEYEVLTRDDAARASLAAQTGGQDVLTYSILAFAAVALLVASLVIANTFQVLVAQRTRSLALLRCVGARKGQLHRSVVLEAAILGLSSSLAGIVLGTVLVQGALVALRTADVGVPLPSSTSLSLAAIVWPLVVGTAVTVVASLVPARAATHVSPLAALRPSDTPRMDTTTGRVRLAVAAVLTLGGASLMALGLVLTPHVGVEIALVVAILGGASSFVGILLSAVLWLPKVVSLVGRLLAPLGPSARLAAANTGRNPRRTAATSTALLIGVTLVAMMSVGAATARASLDDALDSEYPFDITIGTVVDEDAQRGLPDDVLLELRAIDGLSAVVPVRATEVEIRQGGAGSTTLMVQSITPEDAEAISRDPAHLAGLRPGAAVVWQDLWEIAGIFADVPLVLIGQTDTAVTVDPVLSEMPGWGVLVTPDVLDELDPGAPVSDAWLRLDEPDDAPEVVSLVRDLMSDRPVYVSGPALERLQMDSLIDGVLAVILGLLGVAVLIALVGVANTLSLSVLERRRESATLRAIGLSKRQLRRTLAIEGMIVAGVGAVLGILFGLVYGWVGSIVVLSVVGEVNLEVPWADLLTVAGIALVAGLLASVLPARTAARTSPVEALAVE